MAVRFPQHIDTADPISYIRYAFPTDLSAIDHTIVFNVISTNNPTLTINGVYMMKLNSTNTAYSELHQFSNDGATPGSQLRSIQATSGTSIQGRSTLNTAITNGAFNNFCFRCDATSDPLVGNTRFKMNQNTGFLTVATGQNGSGTITPATGDLIIGNIAPISTDASAESIMWDFAIYSEIIDSVEQEAIWNNGNPISPLLYKPEKLLFYAPLYNGNAADMYGVGASIALGTQSSIYADDPRPRKFARSSKLQMPLSPFVASGGSSNIFKYIQRYKGLALNG